MPFSQVLERQKLDTVYLLCLSLAVFYLSHPKARMWGVLHTSLLCSEKEVESFGSHFTLEEQFREGSTFAPFIVCGR